MISADIAGVVKGIIFCFCTFALIANCSSHCLLLCCQIMRQLPPSVSHQQTHYLWSGLLRSINTIPYGHVLAGTAAAPRDGAKRETIITQRTIKSTMQYLLQNKVNGQHYTLPPQIKMIQCSMKTLLYHSNLKCQFYFSLHRCCTTCWIYPAYFVYVRLY